MENVCTGLLHVSPASLSGVGSAPHFLVIMSWNQRTSSKRDIAADAILQVLNLCCSISRFHSNSHASYCAREYAQPFAQVKRLPLDLFSFFFLTQCYSVRQLLCYVFWWFVYTVFYVHFLGGVFSACCFGSPLVRKAGLKYTKYDCRVSPLCSE